MGAQSREFPENWAQDELTKFIDQANCNVVATYDKDENEYPVVSSIDEIFLTIVRALLNPQAIVEAIILMRSHAAYRAAAWLAMAGMNPEVFVQARSCLEYSLYALHMNQNPGLDEVWLRRHDNEATLKKSKNEFRFGQVIDDLEAEDPQNAEVARILYERSIDFGAHPNERSITANLLMEKGSDGIKIQQTTLGGGTVQQRHSLKTTAQVGLCSLYIFRLIFRERFDILGVTERMDHHRNVLLGT